MMPRLRYLELCPVLRFQRPISPHIMNLVRPSQRRPANGVEFLFLIHTRTRCIGFI
jgi:hypothetical protein